MGYYLGQSNPQDPGTVESILDIIRAVSPSTADQVEAQLTQACIDAVIKRYGIFIIGGLAFFLFWRR